jgi:hypothetical protein
MATFILALTGVSEEIAREYATSDGVDRLLSGYVDDDFIHV